MQTNAAGEAREEQHSLAPLQLETGLKHDLASIKRGHGLRLIVAFLGSVLAMAGLLQWIKSSDGHTAYASAAKHMDSLFAQQEAVAPGCALLRPHASDQELRTAIEAASQHYGKAYERHLTSCTPAFVVLERELGKMDVPISVEHRVEGLEHATGALNRAIGRYRSYLLDPKIPYDFTTATPHIDNIVVAWTHYDRQLSNTRAALHAAARTTPARGAR